MIRLAGISAGIVSGPLLTRRPARRPNAESVFRLPTAGLKRLLRLPRLRRPGILGRFSYVGTINAWMCGVSSSR